MNDQKELVYWFAVELAETITRTALERGIPPADILDALNRGLENATRSFRESQDKAELGH